MVFEDQEKMRSRLDHAKQMVGEYVMQGRIDSARWLAEYAVTLRDGLLTDAERSARYHAMLSTYQAVAR